MLFFGFFILIFFIPVNGFSTGEVLVGRGRAILNFAKQWLGTPYLFGGNGRAGIDCSAYAKQMYSDLFGVKLPRTTHTQIDLGKHLPLNPKNPTQGLVAGDLIFFVNALGTPKHVVVYLGDGKITHSESGRGVVIDSIKRVFGRRLIGRRIMTTKGVVQTQKSKIRLNPLEESIEIPCPKETSVPSIAVRKLRFEELSSVQSELDTLNWDLCDLRFVIQKLKNSDGPFSKKNIESLKLQAELVENMDSLESFLKSRLRAE